MDYKVELLKVEDGRRFALLLQHGIPVYYPSLYITTQKRGSSLHTQRNIQHHLRLLYSWCELEGVQLEERFGSGEALKGSECLSLVDFCAWDSATINRIRSGARLLKSAYTEVERHEASARVGHITDYLKFLYKKLVGCGDNDLGLSAMLQEIKSYKPKVKKHRQRSRIELTTDQEAILLEKIMPNHPENPWSANPDVRLRNLIIVHVLLETGMRRSELAALRVSDIDFVNPAVSIYRRHNDRIDPRTLQPQAKTGERSIPLSPALIEQIDNYVLHSRAKVSGAKTHPFLLISHRGGNGSPISVKTINYIFGQLSKAFPALGRLFPHKLRHHWNYNYSRLVDEKMKDLPEDDRRTFDQNSRAYLMGWKPEGTMAQVYNRRFDEDKAKQLLEQRDSKFQTVKRERDDPK
ncbi:tyrosine-type recombinase/integrase [Marinobacter sp. LN3S78]|uniref:tyrosine-type recombinase/integrase n=1 Tax=Marinobacter sp. LN3S78 TaxID=3382300 RepID=UPI00387B43A8